MATPTIPNGEEHFYPIIYEGNGAGQRVGKFVPFTDNGTIANSCIFNDGDSAQMSRTFSTPTDGIKYTISFWMKRGDSSTTVRIFGPKSASGNTYGGYAGIVGDQFYFTDATVGSGANWSLTSERTLEDRSKWYHLMAVFDSANSTQEDRAILYIDGDRVTVFDTENYPTSSEASHINTSGATHYIGRRGYDTNNMYDGYLAEFNFIDGQALTPSTFGLTDTSTGRWIPKALTGITYGTNGFRLTFADSSALGDDTSGNTNDFTATNLASTDQTTDSPTQNHATFDSQRNGGDWTLSEGNLKIVGTPSTGAGRICLSGMNVPNSNKIYWEVEGDAMNDAPRYLGIFRDSVSLTAGSSTEDMRYISIRAGGTHDGKVWDGTSTSSQLTTFSAGDIIQFARDGKKLWIGKNNTWLNSGNPSTGANPLLTNIDTRSNWKMGVYSVSTGTAGASHTFIANTGQRTFSYTPPTGFSAWNQDNLPETAKGISDFIIIKNRDAADSWIWQDSLRGAEEYGSMGSATQYNTAITDGVQKFLAGGFSTEDNDAINTSGESYVAYNFHLNGGTTTTDTSGTLSTELQANAAAGFSVGKFTVSGSGNVTWAHGLGGVPEMGILCAYNSTNYGTTYHHKISTTPYSNGLFLINTDGAFTSSNIWGSAKPTSTLWTGLVGSLFSAGEPYIFYSFRGIEGFSKFGSYTGNGNSDGPFVYTGFRPAMVMVKSSSNAGTGWEIRDNKRSASGGNNPITQVLYPYL